MNDLPGKKREGLKTAGREADAPIQGKSKARPGRKKRKGETEEIGAIAQVLTVGLDPEGHIIMFNGYAEETTGWRADDVLGTSIFGPASGTGRYPCLARKFLEWQEGTITLPHVFENTVPGNNGGTRYISWHLNEMKQAGKKAGLVCYGVDITDKKLLQQDLSLRRTELPSLQAIADIALNAYSPESAFKDIAEELSRITGYPVITIELYDPKRRVMVHKASWGTPTVSAGMEIPLEESLSAVVAQTGVPISEMDIVHRAGPVDKIIRNLNIRTFLCVPMTVEKTVIGTLSLGHREILPVDESLINWATLAAAHIAFLHQRTKTDEARLLARRLESIAILTRGLSHDFNNLLMTMLGNITLARMRLAEREPAATQKLLEAEKAMLEARKLTDRLLTFSKGGQPVKKLVDVRPILQDSIQTVTRGSAVKTEVHIARDLPMVEADENQLRKVLENIVLNALESMTDRGTLTVTAVRAANGSAQNLMGEDREHAVHISIGDKGTGIKPEHLPLLFDPYFTTKEPATLKNRGLGLTVAQAVIKKHQGSLEVESRPGSGTTIHLTLPGVLPPKPLEEPEPEDPSEPGAGRVLVIDDEEDVRRVTRLLLQHMGYDVTMAKTCKEGEDLFASARQKGRPFTAVILDLPLPNSVDGAETIKNLMAMDKDVVAIAAGSQTTDPVLSEFRKHGFRGCLIKPYDLNELRNVLEAVLGK